MRNSPSVKFLRESGRHLTKMRENPLYTGLLNGEVLAKHLTRHLTRRPTRHPTIWVLGDGCWVLGVDGYYV